MHNENKTDEAKQESSGAKVTKPLKKRPLAPGKSSSSVLDTIMASQKSFLSPHHSKANVVGPAERVKYSGDFVHVAQHGDAIKDYVSPEEGRNLHFRRWYIRPKNKPSEKISLLVKGSTHGLREFDHMPFTVSSKVEGQLPFGLEQISKKELADDWLATMLRPNSGLARVRTNVEDQNVLHVDLKSLKDLTQDGLDVTFNPAHSLGT